MNRSKYQQRNGTIKKIQMEILALKSIIAEIKINWMDLRGRGWEGHCRRKGPMNRKTYKQELPKLKSREKKDWGEEDNKAVVTVRQYQAVSHLIWVSQREAERWGRNNDQNLPKFSEKHQPTNPKTSVNLKQGR